MATIKTVAERAGVSVKTVSRVWNEPGSVAEATRNRVIAASEELNFVPDQRARAIRSGRSGVVGLLTDVIASTRCSVDIIHGVEDSLAERGLSLLIGNTENRPGSLDAVLRSFRASRVEGVIYAATYHREVPEFVAPAAMPTVLINGFHHITDMPTVIPDEEAGGYAAGVHLLQLGHKRVTYLTLSPTIEATRLRLAGLMRAYSEAGMPLPPTSTAVAGQTQPGTFDPREAYDAAMRILSTKRRPTAIFCGNDEMALQVYNAAADLNVSIPEQLSVVGFDDHRLFSEGVRPGLTTIALPYQRMGRIGAELLLGDASDTQTRSVVRVEGPLIVRDSTARPPSARRRGTTS